MGLALIGRPADNSFAGTPSLDKNVEKDMGGEVSGMVVEIEEAREDEIFKRRESLQRTPPELSKRTVGEEEESGQIRRGSMKRIGTPLMLILNLD
ncbi:hypothetical protein QE152_g22494 [Popillia japonica]|uniref:Uncharacterized protein n=1 Tax=Popillia japonica TaxID=7064 RepID=A0AAW1KKY0_POPJA